MTKELKTPKSYFTIPDWLQPYKTIRDVAIASFDDGARDKPIPEFLFDVTFVQSGSGNPSPENVRLISGWTGATIYHSDGEDSSDDISISWQTEAGTVYKGVCNAITGELTITHGCVDLSTLTWTEASSSSNRAKTEDLASLIERPATNDNLVEAWCEQYSNYAYSTFGASQGTVIGFSVSATGNLFVRKTTTPGAFTPQGKIVYKLKEPTTVQLTPLELTTLYHENVFSVSTGNIIKMVYPVAWETFYRRYFMLNSGYILLDGGNIDLSTSSAQTITGAWKRITEAIETGKPIWAYNTKYGTGKPLTPVPVFAWYLYESSIVIVGATLHIIVSDDDTCVVQDVAPST